MAKFFITMVFILSTLTRESVCDMSEIATSVWQSAHSVVKSLGDHAHSYLVSFFGQHTVDPLLKTIGDGIKNISQAVADFLNAVAEHIKGLLSFAGIDAKLGKLFTLEGVVFVAQWSLLAVPGYWLLPWAVWLFAGVIKLALFQLNFIFAIIKVLKNIKSLAGRVKEFKKKIKLKKKD